MSSIGHRHSLLTPLSLHGADVEHEVRAPDPGPGLAAPHHPTVLTEGIADPAHVQVLLRHLHLPAHGHLLALVLAVGVPTVRLEEHLVLLTFPKTITIDDHQVLHNYKD